MTHEEFETERENINATLEELDGDAFVKHHEDNKEFINFMWKVESVEHGIEDGFLLHDLDDFDIFVDEIAKEKITKILVDLRARLLEEYS